MNLLELFAPVRTFVFDVEGVLTNGTLTITQDGTTSYTISTKDTYALQQAVAKGYRIILVAEMSMEGLKNYYQQQGITEIHTEVADKKVWLQQIQSNPEITKDNLLYMGDDVPDFTALQIAALPCCPNDAIPEVRSMAKYISPYKGGNGCVRDVIEKVMKLNGDWAIN